MQSSHIVTTFRCLSIYNSFKKEYQRSEDKAVYLDRKLTDISKTKDLEKLLYKSEIDELAFDKKDLKEAVERNITSLLKPGSILRRKKTKFFQILGQFIQENQVAVSSQQQEFLTKKCTS